MAAARGSKRRLTADRVWLGIPAHADWQAALSASARDSGIWEHLREYGATRSDGRTSLTGLNRSTPYDYSTYELDPRAVPWVRHVLSRSSVAARAFVDS